MAPPIARHGRGNNGNGRLHMSSDLRSALTSARKKLAKRGEREFRAEPLAEALDIGFTVIARVEEHMAVNGLRPRDVAAHVGIESGYKWTWFPGLKRRAIEGRWNPTFIQIVRLAHVIGADPYQLIEPLR